MCNTELTAVAIFDTETQESKISADSFDLHHACCFAHKCSFKLACRFVTTDTHRHTHTDIFQSVVACVTAKQISDYFAVQM